MCGVLGIYLQNAQEEDLALVENLFYESQIRGKHSTGLSYITETGLVTVRDRIPAEEFFQKFDLFDALHSNGNLYMIGHTRYSTSDLKYPQPLASENIAISHNGVISQEPKEDWFYKCETNNDSELVLRSLENDSHPFIDFPTASMAVCALDSKNNSLTAFRNHERPLWYSMHERGIIFTSTSDVARRAGLRDIHKTDQLHNYVVEKDQMKVYDCTVPFNIKNIFEDLQ